MSVMYDVMVLKRALQSNISWKEIIGRPPMMIVIELTTMMISMLIIIIIDVIIVNFDRIINVKSLIQDFMVVMIWII